MTGHPFEKEFKQAQRDHLESHRNMETFRETLKTNGRGQQILDCMWVFVYKTDKHGYLQKCKARLVICGNQQAKSDLSAKATTLAAARLGALAIIARRDLEIRQLDAANAFATWMKPST